MNYNVQFKPDGTGFRAYNKHDELYAWSTDVVEYIEDNDYFLVKHQDMTSSLVDKKGNVMPGAFHQNFIEIDEDGYGYEAGDSLKYHTLYSRKGKEMEETRNTDSHFCEDGSYVVFTGNGKRIRYDNGAKRRKRTRLILSLVIGSAIIGGGGSLVAICLPNAIKKYNAEWDKEAAKPATYLKTLSVGGQDVMYFDTDQDLNTVEYAGQIKNIESGANFINLQKGKRMTVQQWRSKGMVMEKLKRAQDYVNQ